MSPVKPGRVTLRRGSSLVETIVALVLLTVGVLGATGTALLAMRRLHEATAREAAVRLAGAILDSLAAAGDVSPGRVRHGPFRAEWSAGPTTRLSLTYPNGAAVEHLGFTALLLERPSAPPIAEDAGP